ncbi:MAG: SPOR domain-containing protein [Muribaculaceae bacterium]|nr:SPOR domain-containing protein [Muribaculaceae bacterium]
MKTYRLPHLFAGIIILSSLLIPAFAKAQSEDEVPTEEINAILRIIEEESAIATYDIPGDILENLTKNPANLKRPGEGKKRVGTAAVKKLQGYRIQVFSDGRNPSTLQSRARARGNAVVARFPKYRGQIYSFSSSPNWYTRIGNFPTIKEANDALAELKAAFPAFAPEMRVVKSPITIIR